MILRLTNVTKKFGHFVAVDNVSFELSKGERIGLIGGNGAGKTTISEMIAGINKPTSGLIEYGFKYNESPKERIGMQFQQSDYPSGLTVKDIITFARNLRKLKELSNEDLRELLEIFQMEDFYKRKVRSLSGGQRQKLNILLSIIHNPEIVILDELSTGLDIAAREDIIEFTDKLLTKKNMSSILISHHMAEIKALCDKVIILDRGRIIDIRKIKDIEKEHGSLDDYMKKLIKDQTKLSKKPSATQKAKNELKEAKKEFRKSKTKAHFEAVVESKRKLRTLEKEEKMMAIEKEKEEKFRAKELEAKIQENTKLVKLESKAKKSNKVEKPIKPAKAKSAGGKK